MQITFRNHEENNAVTLREITCHYHAEAVAQSENNREKMYKYGG